MQAPQGWSRTYNKTVPQGTNKQAAYNSTLAFCCRTNNTPAPRHKKFPGDFQLSEIDTVFSSIEWDVLAGFR